MGEGCVDAVSLLGSPVNFCLDVQCLIACEFLGFLCALPLSTLSALYLPFTTSPVACPWFKVNYPPPPVSKFCFWSMEGIFPPLWNSDIFSQFSSSSSVAFLNLIFLLITHLVSVLSYSYSGAMDKIKQLKAKALKAAYKSVHKHHAPGWH